MCIVTKKNPSSTNLEFKEGSSGKTKDGFRYHLDIQYEDACRYFLRQAIIGMKNHNFFFKFSLHLFTLFTYVVGLVKYYNSFRRVNNFCKYFVNRFSFLSSKIFTPSFQGSFCVLGWTI